MSDQNPVEAASADGHSTPPSRFFTLLAGTVVLLLAILAVAGVRAYGDLAEAREREAELEALVSDAESRIEELEAQVEELQSDPEALERVARDELGLVYPDEAVVRLPEER